MDWLSSYFLPQVPIFRLFQFQLSWRKTFGREVWRRNKFSEASLIKLSILFNHSSTAITRIYLDITREEVANLYDIDDLFVY